jgi:adenine-specific DNA-methyltransferase
MVRTSLAEKESLRGQVQMIYMDPPYGIRFGSNWQVSTRKRDVRDGRVEDATREPEVVKAFRDTWELGIHSYLAYLRDRLAAARELLAESGAIFVQIGDENVQLVRLALDEVFGSQNYCSQVVFRKTTGKASELLDNTYDCLLWYAKDRERLKYRALFTERSPAEDQNLRFVELADRSRRAMSAQEVENPTSLPVGARVFRPNPLTSQSRSQTTTFEYEFGGKVFSPGVGGWKTNLDGMRALYQAGRLLAVGNSLSFIRYLDDFPYKSFNDIWDDTRQSGFGDPKIFVVQTATRVVERCVLMTTDPGDLILDPTCGSGTTAYVAEQWGRRWITVDTSRVALALARTRLMAARYPYYLLRDSEAGQRKEAELSGQAPPSPLPPTSSDIRQGFVYGRVPHVTLKSIANNPDIREGMTREEIDAAIARHGETELLYDRPYADPRVVRVAGPFTTESLSPHRMVDADGAPSADADPTRFISLIVDNLRKAGVQNTVKNERLVFETLEQWPGTYVQAMGDFKESGRVRRCAVAIGPEYSTVGPQLVREAAKEAARAGADLLVVCGFAFEAQVGDEPGQFGKLALLKAKMNPDLAMGDELLKKTGAGNLFMVFGEPDIAIERKDGEVTVEIRGVDVYDPTTGQVRSHSTDDIATWFIDTNYDRESFRVRQAYFLGADEPYEKLKRALRADIDEAAWASLYTTKSRPFPVPETGEIAVKVINHYGDEVLKRYPV